MTAEVRSVWKTGVEVEAMAAVTGALLNAYDMLRPLDESIRFTDIQVVKKRGGKTHFADNEGMQLVFTTGGTGLGPRDMTPEATLDVLERTVPGIVETIRKHGKDRTPYAMLASGCDTVIRVEDTQEQDDIVKEKLPTLKNDSFAENIITRGINLTALKIGDRVQFGDDVVLEITQIGKKYHNDGCAIKKLTGDCIMPKEGLFGKVITGGTLSSNNRIRPL